VPAYPNQGVDTDHGTLPDPRNAMEGLLLQLLMHPDPRLAMGIA